MLLTGPHGFELHMEYSLKQYVVLYTMKVFYCAMHADPTVYCSLCFTFIVIFLVVVEINKLRFRRFRLERDSNSAPLD